MQKAVTISEIENKIIEENKGSYIILILLSQYRNDPQSIPWRIAANSMNFHHQSGPDVDIYVPGFSLEGENPKEDLGEWISLENSNPLRYYYPQASTQVYDFLKNNMKGISAASNLCLIAVEVKDNIPDWRDGIVMDLSKIRVELAEERIVEAIEGCKKSVGHINVGGVRFFKRNNRLNRFAAHLSANGWNMASVLVGVGALMAGR